MLRPVTLTAAVLALGLTALASAGDEDTYLTIGDRAPDFDIAHWVKGDQIEDFESGNVYVMEFWATWCGPCVASMPHLSEMQAKYKDYGVTFVGVSDEPLQTVVNFLFKTYPADNKIQNDRIQYTLTADPDRSVYNDYFKAAGQRGIPCAFIIGKDRKVEWIGHPMQMDEPLDAVVRDNWDRHAFKTKWEKEQAAERKMAKVQGKLFEAINAEDYDTAVEIMDGLLAEHPDNLSISYQKFMLLLTKMDQPEEAYAFGHTVLKNNWDNAQLLNQIAWTVVDDKNITHRDTGFALKAADRANELTEGKDPAILDTVARVHWVKGDYKSALKWQKKAAEHAAGSPFEAEINERLEEYKKK